MHFFVLHTEAIQILFTNDHCRHLVLLSELNWISKTLTYVHFFDKKLNKTTNKYSSINLGCMKMLKTGKITNKQTNKITHQFCFYNWLLLKWIHPFLSLKTFLKVLYWNTVQISPIIQNKIIVQNVFSNFVRLPNFINYPTYFIVKNS